MTIRTTSTVLLFALAACTPASQVDDDTQVDDTLDEDTGSGTEDTSVDDTGADDTGTDDTAAPAKAPEIADTAPADGERGVMPNRLIVVHFTEPMDHASVEAALSSKALGEDGFTVAWGSDTSLSIIPKAKMEVLAANDSDKGEEIDIRIGTGARSQAGLALAEEFSSSFQVARSYTVSFGYEPTLTGRLGSSGPATVGSFHVGDAANGTAYQSVATFDLEEVPTVVEVDQAVLRIEVSQVKGNPFDTLGDLGVDLVDIPVLKESAYDAPALTATVVGPDSISELGTWSVDVTSLVAYAMKDRVALDDLVQLRLAFEEATSANDKSDVVMFYREPGTPKLTVSLFVE
ncbi:MAG: Ig-like domain-containing protein [Alphaproteobacteria bacterium]|nr:Ig-like domain-containing protein [Alphaproteobacteria bacterium]